MAKQTVVAVRGSVRRATGHRVVVVQAVGRWEPREIHKASQVASKDSRDSRAIKARASRASRARQCVGQGVLPVRHAKGTGKGRSVVRGLTGQLVQGVIALVGRVVTVRVGHNEQAADPTKTAAVPERRVVQEWLPNRVQACRHAAVPARKWAQERGGQARALAAQGAVASPGRLRALGNPGRRKVRLRVLRPRMRHPSRPPDHQLASNSSNSSHRTRQLRCLKVRWLGPALWAALQNWRHFLQPRKMRPRVAASRLVATPIPVRASLPDLKKPRMLPHPGKSCFVELDTGMQATRMN